MRTRLLPSPPPAARPLLLGALLAGLALATLNAAEPARLLPTAADGRTLNLDFEDGSLRDWKAEGNAFDRQPVRGDTVFPRRNDMRSEHQGNYWIGTYEVGGDDLTGTLSSAPFRVTHPWASFRVGGGNWPSTRVELVRADNQQVFFKVSGVESETLRPVVVDLQKQLGRDIFIRIVDQQKGHWGHINFDDFQFHAQRPKPANELDPTQTAAPPADVVKFAGLSPDQAAREATVPPGFKVHLFAGEPDVRQPIAFCLDHRGRIWVAEGFTYPRRKGRPPADAAAPNSDPSKPSPAQLKDIFGGDDRILVFEDTDGDHDFDKRTVFAENINLISGLEVGFGGVWIGAAPYLLFLPVADWDNPRPAGDPRILLDGWNFTADTHETLNTFTWGPDGWLYGCHGVFCPSHVGKPGAPVADRQWMDAGVWRYHPVRNVFEVFTEGGSNPWGIDFNEHGQLFAEMCVIPHFWHMIQGARIERQGGEHFAVGPEETRRYGRPQGKPVHPHVYDDIKTHGDHVHWAGGKGPHAANARSDAVGGGHAHAGLLVYQGDSWPDEYRGKIFMGNIHGQRLNMDIPVRQGSGFVGKHGPDFLNFNDTWSQTLHQISDPEGSVYIIDWYDKNQCHHNREDGHDRANGRIFKIVYGNRPGSRPDLARLSDDELVKLQLHRNEWHVRQSRKLLQQRAAEGRLSPAAREQLAVLVRTHADPVRRLRALWTLHATGGLDARIAIDALKDGDEYVRAWTIQLAFESWEGLQRLMAEANAAGIHADPDLYQMAESDPSALVRLYIAAAMQRAPMEIRARALEKLLQRREDVADHNLPLMIWFAMEPIVADHPREALQAAAATPLPRILNFTARRIASLGTPEARNLIAEALQNLDDPARQLDVLAGLSAALKGQRSVPLPDGWTAVEARLSSSSNPQISTLVQSLSLTFGSTNALASLKRTVLSDSADAGSRRAALDSLLASRDPSLPALLQSLLANRDLRAQALRALAGFDDPKTPAAILAAYGTLDSQEQRDALNTLASRASFALPLMNSVGGGLVPKSALTAELIRQLRNLKDPAVNTQLEKVYGTIRDTSADKQQEIERYRRIYGAGGSQPGDASRGRAVYNQVCAQCHLLFDVGGKVGPDITGSNRGDLNYLLETILDPNAVIPNDYRASTVETKDGRSVTGIVKQQDDKAVTIMTQTETLVLPRAEIESIQQSELSMMPEGLLAPLSDQQFRDLIYYLSRPGQVPLPQ